MEKINIAELLKDCPQGMELDCTMYEDCKFLDVETEGNRYLIRITTPCGIKYLDKYGCYTTSDKAKCVIFPKGKTTWEGFVPPCKFKDGDIIADNHKNIAIYKGKIWYNCNLADFYCGYRNYDNRFLEKPKKDGHFGSIEELHLATEEEKAKLFDTIKANGYKWNAETKTLEKLTIPKFKVGDVIINIYRKYLNCDSKGGKISKIIDDKYIFDTGSYTHIQCQDNYELVSNKLVEPKFKVGDKIVKKNSGYVPILITNVGDEFYYSNTESSVGVLPISEQDDWELVSNKFDINTLVPFESRVLVRDSNYGIWRVSFWGCLINTENGFNYDTIRGCYKQCVPYEQNEHLLGKTDDCDEYYKSWE